MSKIKKDDYVKYVGTSNNQLEGEVLRTRRNGAELYVRWIGYVESMWYGVGVLEKIQ